MKIRIDEKYHTAIIELKGDLTGGDNASLFREKLYELINKQRNNIVIDMSDIKYVNSSGIGILISGFTTVKNAGGEMKLANISDKVNGVLNITKLNNIFDIHPNVDNAVKSFGHHATAGNP
jgi:anti-sigma B factor antagonist